MKFCQKHFQSLHCLCHDSVSKEAGKQRTQQIMIMRCNPHSWDEARKTNCAGWWPSRILQRKIASGNHLAAFFLAVGVVIFIWHKVPVGNAVFWVEFLLCMHLSIAKRPRQPRGMHMIKKFNFPHLIVSLTFYYSAVTLIQLFLRDCKMLTFAQGGSTKIHYVPV